MSKDNLAGCALAAFQIWEAKELIDDDEAADLIAFANGKTCTTLCKVLNKIARLEVEGSASGEECHRAVGIGKAEAMFQLVDHFAALRTVLEQKKAAFFNPPED